ncbi:DUF481 domain-containing protein [Pseudoroseicyclus aestuarii]|uniref:Putative salt-induced outer membrane protein n=1 Tax=Pseudoroseicyclus aestuarii TaxID=1795041 RepID=A0A318SU87_9RHOB|nr:DUF481 domain-containing protein [Pseudoroseicyclus aestuarii]PYE84925.1 putative salt-induced outer membrane protein [Pseudoroseicyclus aestuarii]
MKAKNIFVLATISSFVAGAAMAQSPVFSNEDLAEDQIEDLQDDIEDDFERETYTYAADGGMPTGFTGSVAGRATLTNGNTDNQDAGVGASFGYYDGLNGHKVQLSYTYSEVNNNTSDNSLVASYDYTRDLTPQVYGFVKAIAVYDEFDSYEEDYFVGAGLGYRVFSSADVQWAVQAGPGYRWTKNQNGDEEEEAALNVSSDFFYRINETVAMTNDTEILYSDSNTYVTNDFGVNYSMTDALALRASVLTEYNTDPLPGFDDTDNQFGLSVVYNFN